MSWKFWKKEAVKAGQHPPVKEDSPLERATDMEDILNRKVADLERAIDSYMEENSHLIAGLWSERNQIRHSLTMAFLAGIQYAIDDRREFEEGNTPAVHADLIRLEEQEEHYQEIEMEVGEWDEQMGTYCVAEKPEERCMIQASLTEQGCVLKLRAPGKPEVGVYVERMGDSNEWRVNITPDYHTDTTHVTIAEDGELRMD